LEKNFMTDPRFISGSSRLTGLDHKTLWLATLGGILEFYDFIIFVFFANTIGELFFPPGIPDWIQQFQTYGIFAVGYLVRPLGGILMAHAGDLRGRKRMFTFSIFLMGLSTLGIGLLPTYATLGALAPVCLLLLRIGQGAAVGGEVPGGWVFVSEHVNRSRVGIACGLLTAGLTAGILLGSLVATGLNALMPPEQLTNYGWRIAFVLGGIFGLISVYLRRLLSETPVFEELKARQELAAELPLKAVVRDYRPAIILSGLLTWVLSAAIVVTILMTPALLEKGYHVPRLARVVASELLGHLGSDCGRHFGRMADRPIRPGSRIAGRLPAIRDRRLPIVRQCTNKSCSAHASLYARRPDRRNRSRSSLCHDQRLPSAD
jgi:MFS transporter, MHS family, proline/betaine transporter